VCTTSGCARLGLVGFAGLAKRCGAGYKEGSEIHDPSSAQQAGIDVAQQATGGLRPDFVFLCAAPGREEHMLRGINKVWPGVRIFGSSAANDTLMDGDQHEPWQLYGSIAGWGAIKDGGVAAMAIWLSDAARMHNVLLHAYGETQHRGMVTNASGRDIFQIDGKNAADVFLEWTQLSLPLKPKEVAQFALAFDDRLVDVKGIGDKGELQVFASHAADRGLCEAALVSVKPGDVIGAIKEVAAAAKRKVTFEVRGAVVAVCAGTSAMFSDADLEKLNVNLRELAPEVAVTFSFGEQGNARAGQNAYHGNNMLSFLFFG